MFIEAVERRMCITAAITKYGAQTKLGGGRSLDMLNYIHPNRSLELLPRRLNRIGDHECMKRVSRRRAAV